MELLVFTLGLLAWVETGPYLNTGLYDWSHIYLCSSVYYVYVICVLKSFIAPRLLLTLANKLYVYDWAKIIEVKLAARVADSVGIRCFLRARDSAKWALSISWFIDCEVWSPSPLSTKVGILSILLRE